MECNIVLARTTEESKIITSFKQTMGPRECCTPLLNDGTASHVARHMLVYCQIVMAPYTRLQAIRDQSNLPNLGSA